MLKSIFSASIFSRFTIAVPTLTNAPTEALRNPTTPANGARMMCLSSRTLASSSVARAPSNAAIASSRARSVTLPVFASWFGAVEIGLGERIASFLLRDLRAHQRIIELDQDVALADLFAFPKRDFGNPAGQFGGDLDQLVGLQAADRMNVRTGGRRPRDRCLHRHARTAEVLTRSFVVFVVHLRRAWSVVLAEQLNASRKHGKADPGDDNQNEPFAHHVSRLTIDMAPG